MRQHVIIGRYGIDDHICLNLENGEVETSLNFVGADLRLDYSIGQALENLNAIGVYPTEVGLDLLVLAVLVHAADTRISRSTESQDGWTREIRLVVPVSDPDRWDSVSLILQQILKFLTGDIWTVEFRPRPHNFCTIVPPPPRQQIIPPFDKLALFSGGLDSLIGAIDMLESGHTPLFISHAGEGATSDAQNKLFEALRNHYGNCNFKRFRFWMVFPDDLVSNLSIENTTRGRSFLFFALGIFASTGLVNSFVLQVPENGFIALNVPLDPLRLGALSTRTTHPFYMAQWNKFLERLGISGRVENPYWYLTKGEMVEGCANNVLLNQVVSLSMSCSSPTKSRWIGQGSQHCGYCLPCLIRRAAIKVGLENDPTTYTISNLQAQPLRTNQSEGQQVRSFQLAIKRLQARPNLAPILVHKPGPLIDVYQNELSALADVYRRGLEEVSVILDGVRTVPA